MDPRPPDSVYSDRLIDPFDELNPFDQLNPFDNPINQLTNEEIIQLENIELAQIQELEIEELEAMQFKEIDQEENIFKQTILQSKKDTFEDIIQKLILTKSRIPEQHFQEKFTQLEQKISQYLQSIDPIESIDIELDQFIDWLCDKTAFSRYKYKDILKSVLKLKPTSL